MNDEMADIHIVYGRVGDNGRLAKQINRERFPKRRFLHHTTRRWILAPIGIGSFQKRNEKRSNGIPRLHWKTHTAKVYLFVRSRAD
ncbi:hypothetical protein CEXT_597351 [Caerostris extrusa]|uniref:Uncharacterized protein n=1 Tax=Caerostris extrusa TaxID=172846 RepID=A0AAV4Q0J2_CAEEX|nr:hypothetical protein CEXT_597351 [Caerostris extrusa]